MGDVHLSRLKAGFVAVACAVVPVVSLSSAETEQLVLRQEWELPTHRGDKPSYHAPAEPPKAGPIPDARALFETALNCWPAPSYFRADVSLEGRLRNDRSAVLNADGGIESGSRASAALVVRVPLYSGAELDREREREYMRRGKAADAVGDLIAALADRNRTLRELQLMRALERRAQERVRIGVAETAEQVKYLEKVADLEGAVIKQRGTIEKTRLALLGMCAAQQTDGFDRYIEQFVKDR